MCATLGPRADRHFRHQHATGALQRADPDVEDSRQHAAGCCCWAYLLGAVGGHQGGLYKNGGPAADSEALMGNSFVFAPDVCDAAVYSD